jgi:hypothetical protein
MPNTVPWWNACCASASPARHPSRDRCQYSMAYGLYGYSLCGSAQHLPSSLLPSLVRAPIGYLRWKHEPGVCAEEDNLTGSGSPWIGRRAKSLPFMSGTRVATAQTPGPRFRRCNRQACFYTDQYAAYFSVTPQPDTVLSPSMPPNQPYQAVQ